MTDSYPTKTQLDRYLQVQHSGVTNMFDLPVVMKLTGLSKETILQIMKHYSELKEAYYGNSK